MSQSSSCHTDTKAVTVGAETSLGCLLKFSASIQVSHPFYQDMGCVAHDLLKIKQLPHCISDFRVLLVVIKQFLSYFLCFLQEVIFKTKKSGLRLCPRGLNAYTIQNESRTVASELGTEPGIRSPSVTWLVFLRVCFVFLFNK